MGANGNYIPMQGRAGPPSPPLPTHCHPCAALSGNGPPDGVVPSSPGTRYTDIATGLEYLKISGTQSTGWQLVGSVGQAGVQVIG